MKIEHLEIQHLIDMSEIPPGSLIHFTSFHYLMAIKSLGIF